MRKNAKKCEKCEKCEKNVKQCEKMKYVFTHFLHDSVYNILFI